MACAMSVFGRIPAHNKCPLLLLLLCFGLFLSYFKRNKVNNYWYVQYQGNLESDFGRFVNASHLNAQLLIGASDLIIFQLRKFCRY